MEPISTTAIISATVGYLAKTLNDNKTFHDFIKDFTGATVEWIKPLFLKEEKPNDILVKLIEKPESESRQQIVRSTIEAELESNPASIEHLQEIYNYLQTKRAQESIQISNSKNVVTGDINTNGGNFIIGDSNK